MRKQKRRGLILGLLTMLLASLTGLLFTSRIAALERQIGDRQRVVVARTTIAPRTLITSDMLEERELPRQFAHPSYLQSMSDIANQRVAVIEIPAGSIVRHNDVAPVHGLESSMRAISIGANPISVQVDRVTPGSRVDVIVSYETSSIDAQGQERRTRRTITMLKDVEVLAVAGAPQTRSQSLSPEPTAAASDDGLFGLGAAPAVDQLNRPLISPYGLRDSVVVVTLKVSPADAQKLAYADTFASDIRLALRRPDDRSIEPLPPVSEEDFQ